MFGAGPFRILKCKARLNGIGLDIGMYRFFFSIS